MVCHVYCICFKVFIVHLMAVPWYMRCGSSVLQLWWTWSSLKMEVDLANICKHLQKETASLLTLVNYLCTAYCKEEFSVLSRTENENFIPVSRFESFVFAQLAVPVRDMGWKQLWLTDRWQRRWWCQWQAQTRELSGAGSCDFSNSGFGPVSSRSKVWVMPSKSQRTKPMWEDTQASVVS